MPPQVPQLPAEQVAAGEVGHAPADAVQYEPTFEKSAV
jgi:hypothetical protein